MIINNSFICQHDLAKVLKFKISKFESDIPEEDTLFFIAMEESRKSDLVTKTARHNFENSLLELAQ